MEIIDSEDDEYKWLDAGDNTEAAFAHRNTVKMITLFEGKWIIRPKRNIDKSDTLVVYYSRNVATDREDLNALFEVAQNYKIRRIIFNKIKFRRALWETKFVDSIQELVFNDCCVYEGSIGGILDDLHKGDSCNLRKFVLRNSNDIIHDLRTININTPHKYHKLRTIKLINCKIRRRNLDTTNYDGSVDIVHDFTPESEYTKEGNDDFKEALEITKKYLDNNNNGYRKCQQVCLLLIHLKRNKLSPLFISLDPNVLTMIVNIIWMSRYENLWYEDIDPYGDSSSE